MCIIIVKPAYRPLPPLEIFQNSGFHNADGAGFCTPSGGKVQGRKGYKHASRLYRALQSIPISEPIIIHFRYATHGGMDATATHPFPITSSIQSLQARIWKADIGIAHNGIVPGYGRHSELSDTQDYIRGVLSLPEVYPRLFEPKVQRAIQRQTHSKFALMDGKGRLALIGDFIEDNGIFYSNSDYLTSGAAWLSCVESDELDMPKWR